MLQNACYCGTTAFGGFYCKVCCSMNSVGTTPSRLTSRFSSERGNRTASKLTPSSSYSSFCTAPSSKTVHAVEQNVAASARCRQTNRCPAVRQSLVQATPDHCHRAPTAIPAGACRLHRAGFAAQRPQANRVCYRPRGSASLVHQSPQHHHHLLDLQHAIRFGRIDHVQQQVGIARLFERRPKCLDQLVGQMTNETYCVGQDNRPQVVDIQTAQGRVKGGEQLVGRVNVRFRHVVEQRGFAGVGIAHQGHGRDIRTRAATA